MWESQLCVLLLVPFSPLMLAAQLQPGQPGAPWTEEEVEVTREKVNTNALILKILNLIKPPGAGHAGLYHRLLVESSCGKAIS